MNKTAKLANERHRELQQVTIMALLHCDGCSVDGLQAHGLRSNPRNRGKKKRQKMTGTRHKTRHQP